LRRRLDFSLVRDLFLDLLPLFAGAFFLFLPIIGGKLVSVFFQVARFVAFSKSHESSFSTFLGRQTWRAGRPLKPPPPYTGRAD
jgi:hypothetical protein